MKFFKKIFQKKVSTGYQKRLTDEWLHRRRLQRARENCKEERTAQDERTARKRELHKNVHKEAN